MSLDMRYRPDERDDVVRGPDDALEERRQARQRVAARRDFAKHVVTYLLVNALIVVMWASTGAGYFWPGWVIGAWGVGLALHGWDVYLRQPVTEADVDAELRRRRR
jgi:hypothetical protein